MAKRHQSINQGKDTKVKVKSFAPRQFEPGNTPGVGTFYDFINRLWNSDDDHMSPHIHPLKTRVKKPKTKGTKADSVEKVTVAELLPSLENTVFNLDE